MNFRAIAYPASWRLAGALLVVVSRGSLLVLLVALMFFDTRLSNPLRLLRAFTAFCLVPELAAWLLARAFEVRAAIENGTFILHRRGQRIEIPCEAIERVVPWVVPIPSGGMWLRLRSGRRFRYGLQVADPIALAEALADAGASAEVRAAAASPAAIYARSKRDRARRWYHAILKFPIFALVPTLPLFRLHQWIAYGGTFGEYYMFGLKAYLLAFAIHWSTFTIYLVLYAAALRAVAEPVVLGGVYAMPGRAATLRRVVEIVRRFLYYGGVPVLLARLFLAS